MIQYISKKVRNPFDRHAFDTIEDFIHALATALQRDGIVKVELQPGDATRYQFRLVFTFRDRNLVVLHDFDDISTIVNKDTDPWKVAQDTSWNIFTICLVCDLYQQLFVGDDDRIPYYDWEKGCPMKDGVPIR